MYGKWNKLRDNRPTDFRSIAAFKRCIFTSAKEGMFSSLFVCLFVCLLATLRKNFQTDLHEIFRESWQWANEQMAKFWWRSGSRIRIRIRIATVVRHALTEVFIVPVVLVNNDFSDFSNHSDFVHLIYFVLCFISLLIFFIFYLFLIFVFFH